MSCLEGLVREYLTGGQEELQKALSDWLTAGSVRSYLPQTWVLATEQESLAIHLDAGGAITIHPGTAVVRDGVVTIRHDVLADSLRAGRGPPPHSFQVSFYTDNGKAAFEKLARLFGL